jgi:solute carrier family 35, member C2
MNLFIFILLGLFFAVAALCQIFLFVVRRYRKYSTTLATCSISAKARDVHQYQRLHQALDVISIAFIWYTISLSFTLFNKWFMQEWRGGFNFPIFITSVHMVMKFFISIVWSLSPSVDKIDPLSWSTFLLVVLPIGTLTAADIILANSSMLFLPLSLVTTIKGSSLIFTFLWGVVLQIEIFQWSLLAAVLGITLGLGIAVSNSIELNMIGFFLAFASAASGGLRWALMQLLEVKDSQSKSVMVTLYRFSPASVVSIVPLVFILEEHKIANSDFALHTKNLYDAILLCSFGGLIAFLLIVAEVKLVRLTSSLTMSVFGQIKEIIQIVLAMIIFKENLTIQCVVGIAVSIVSSCFYRYVIVSRVVDEDLDSTDRKSKSQSVEPLPRSESLNDLSRSYSRTVELKEQELSLLRS